MNLVFLNKRGVFSSDVTIRWIAAVAILVACSFAIWSIMQRVMG